MLRGLVWSYFVLLIIMSTDRFIFIANSDKAFSLMIGHIIGKTQKKFFHQNFVAVKALWIVSPLSCIST